MSYGINLRDFTAHSAVYVDKILRGAEPDDLPVEQPAQLAPVLNVKTARALELDIPRSLIARADTLIR